MSNPFKKISDTSRETAKKKNNYDYYASFRTLMAIRSQAEGQVP